MDWKGKQRCVLECNGDGCPISVHESCMGCKPYFDDMGNFHCPYCIYKELLAETCELLEKVLVAKQEMSTFLDEISRNGNCQNPGISSKYKDEKKLVSDDLQSQCEESSKKGGKNPSNNINACRIMVVYTPNSCPDDAWGFDSILHKRKEDGMKGNQVESVVGKKSRVGNAKRKFDDGHTGNIDITESSDRVIQLPLWKASRVLWKEEEIEMLKEGVQKFSRTVRKNLPWIKILEFGGPVFDSCRTPSDLKDKWRNMKK